MITMNINKNIEEKEKQKRYLIQITVDGEIKNMWSALDQTERRALAKLFRNIVASYTKTRSFIPLDIKALYESLEVCKAQLELFRAKSRDLEKQLSAAKEVSESLKTRASELEKMVEWIKEEKKKEVESIDAAYRDKIEKLMKEADRWRNAYQNTKQIILALCNMVSIVPSNIKRDIGNSQKGVESWLVSLDKLCNSFCKLFETPKRE